MARTIKILNVDPAADAGGCGTSPQLLSQDFAAGIDTDIFEADTLELGGERFWEAFWRTQHTYGGVSEGQGLAEIFAALEDRVLDKLVQDVTRLQSEASAMSDEEKDDVLGMVMFLLTLERADPDYNPFEVEGFDGALSRFLSSAKARQQRG